MKCSTKILLSITLQNMELDDVDYIETYISKLEDLNGVQQALRSPYKITISKSPVYVSYPCSYQQDFNYHPIERVITSDLFTCEDGDLASNPTCGWAYDSNGKIISYSQGFCCKCSLSDLIGTGSSSIRGNQCKILNLGTGSASAHCWAFNELWFSAFNVKQYQLEYVIKVNVIQVSNENDEEIIIKTLELTPSNTISSTDNGDVIVKWIGDFLPSSTPDDFSNYYLLIPSSPQTHIMVAEGSLNWMLVEKEMFTLNGLECDKIGVGYYAFQTQGTGCKAEISACLSNQIYDLYQSDLKRLIYGQNPKYLWSQDFNREYSFYVSNSTNSRKFAYKLKGNINTLLTLEINADDIRYVTNTADGAIDRLEISDFEAMSLNGLLLVQITNIGTISSKFFVSYNCSDNIIPWLSDEISLKAMKTEILKKSVYTASSLNSYNICTVTLKNSVGKVTDENSVNFNTTETERDNNQDTSGDGNGKGDGDHEEDEAAEWTCKEYCPGFFSFGCFIVHGCWWYFGRVILVIVLVVGLIVTIVKMILNGIWLKCCLKLFKKSKNKKKKKEKRKDTKESNEFTKDDESISKDAKNKNNKSERGKNMNTRSNKNQKEKFIKAISQDSKKPKKQSSITVIFDGGDKRNDDYNYRYNCQTNKKQFEEKVSANNKNENTNQYNSHDEKKQCKKQTTRINVVDKHPIMDKNPENCNNISDLTDSKKKLQKSPLFKTGKMSNHLNNSPWFSSKTSKSTKKKNRATNLKTNFKLNKHSDQK